MASGPNAGKKKSKTNDIEDVELDFDDLSDIGDMGDDLNFEETDLDTRETAPGGVAKELATQAGEGVLEGLITKTAKVALPESYNNNYYEMMDYADFAKSTFQNNSSKVKNSVYKLGKEVKKILPFQFKMLDKFLEDYESDNEQYRQESEEAMRDSSIQSNLGSIFDKQLEVQKAIEAKRDASDAVETKERITTNRMSMEVLSSIDSNIANHTAFTLQITKEYYRKSLELQYKTYYIQADMLKTMRDYYKGFSQQFENIQKNTGLPDYVKLTGSEQVSEILRQQTIQKTYGAMFSNSKYIENVKKRMSGVVDNAISGVTEKMNTITDQLNMLNSASDGSGSSSLGLLSGILSNMMGGTVGEKVAEKYAPKLKDKIKNNKYINAGGNYLDALATSPSGLFANIKAYARNKEEDYQDQDSPGRFILNKIFGGVRSVMDVTDPGKMDANVYDKGIMDHDKPAIFDNNVHRSITEVIPMYLSKILKENTDLKTMYQTVNQANIDGKFTSSEEMVYNFGERKLGTFDEYRQYAEEKVLASQKTKTKASLVSNTLISSTQTELKKEQSGKKLTIEEKLKLRNKQAILSDKKAQEKLSEFISKASKIEGIDVNFETIVNNIGTDKADSRLTAIVEKDPKLQEMLKIIKENTNRVNIKGLDDRLSDVTRNYPLTALKELFVTVSKLADNKTNYKVTDDQLGIIAKTLSVYMTNHSDEITPELIMKGSAFKYLTEEEHSKVKTVLQLLVSDFAKINNSGDIAKTSALIYAVGLVSRSLRSNFETTAEPFQKLRNLSPHLGHSGKLTQRNLIERKLGKEEDVRYVDIQALKETVKVSRASLKQIREDATLSSLEEKIAGISDNLGGRVKDMMTDIRSQGVNPISITSTVLKHLNKNLKDARQAMTAQYDKSAKTMSGLVDTLKTEVTLNTLPTVRAQLVSKLTENVNSIQSLIDNEKKTHYEKIRELQDAKNKVGEVVNKENALKEVDTKIKRMERFHTVTIKSLEKTKQALVVNLNTLQQLDLNRFTDENAVSDMLKMLRQQFNNTVSEFKEAAKKVQEAETQI